MRREPFERAVNHSDESRMREHGRWRCMTESGQKQASRHVRSRPAAVIRARREKALCSRGDADRRAHPGPQSVHPQNAAVWGTPRTPERAEGSEVPKPQRGRRAIAPSIPSPASSSTTLTRSGMAATSPGRTATAYSSPSLPLKPWKPPRVPKPHAPPGCGACSVPDQQPLGCGLLSCAVFARP